MTQKPIFLETADRIGFRLCRDAFWSHDRCTWLGWSLEAIDSKWQGAYRSFGGDLYSGTSGICLFLAELYAMTGDARLRKTIEGGARHALDRVASIVGAQRIGFYSGVSGIAYALVRVAEVLGDEALSVQAQEDMASLGTLEPDAHFLDVIGGSAGAIPALLAVGTQCGRDDFVQAAIAQGEHLLRTATRGEKGWSWDTMHVPNQSPLTGHSHGAAGIATALLELYRVTQEQRFYEAALNALAYERTLFCDKHRNWPDLRTMHTHGQTEPVYNMAWCHGAPGIGLSRLRCLALLDGDVEVKTEVEAALSTTASTLSMPWTQGMGNYSLCHGAAGNAELMIEAGTTLKRADLWQVAEKVGLDGYQNYGQFDMSWPCGTPGLGESPGLMLGLAGIGYFYLRLYDPYAVSSMLLIQPTLPAKRAAQKVVGE